MKAIAALIGASLVAAPAFAGGMNQPLIEAPVAAPAAPVVVARANGDWSGFYAGANLGYGDFKAESSTASVAKGNGMIGGVQAGYRWDLGNTVFGVEGAYSSASIKDDVANAEVKNKADLKLQLGYDLGASLIYATAGVSHAKFDMAGTSYSDNGWVAGLGYDYALNQNWTLGGEYLHNSFSDVKGTGVDVTGNTFAIRANYKF